jgi:predicted aconitase with swiveling domain
MAEFEARTLAPGRGQGPVVRLDEPLSLWGGMDPATGRLIDRRHPQFGANLAGCVLVMRSGRGSSSSSTVLAEATRAGTGPVAIVLVDPDPILALGSIVAAELYGTAIPIVVVQEPVHRAIPEGLSVTIVADDGVARVVVHT